MAYPWYSTGTRVGALDGFTAVTIEENYETKARRFRIDAISRKSRRGLVSATGPSLRDAASRLCGKSDEFRDRSAEAVSEFSRKLGTE